MTRRAVVILALAVLLVGAIVFGLSQCQRANTAGTQAKVAKGQAGSAIESGSDAVDTIGNRMDADRQQQQIVEETYHAIGNATDAAGVTDAGRDGLCRLAGNRGRAECVQPARPR